MQELERQEIEAEEEEEKKKRRNILDDLEHRFEQVYCIITDTVELVIKFVFYATDRMIWRGGGHIGFCLSICH